MDFKKYNIQDARSIEQFKEDAFKELGIEKHPQAEEAFTVAWRNGYNFGGLREIYHHLEGMARYLKDTPVDIKRSKFIDFFKSIF